MEQVDLNVALIIPTWNAEKYIETLFKQIKRQSLQPQHILVIDSSSTDNTRTLLNQYPVRIHTIPQGQFDHGGTRQLATELVNADIYIFMTQDALPANDYTFKNLIQDLIADPMIGCVYGRQLPAANANPLSAHLRLFNYPEISVTKTYEDKQRFGIKTCFNSNSFAAYSKCALKNTGGFPAQLILGEDIYLAGKILLNQLKIRYSAEAQVYHSHNFNMVQEFKRYFSIGVFHQREKWIVETFNAPTREGIKYIYSEIRYLIKTKKIHWLPRACVSWMAKFIGYKLGRGEKYIPRRLKQRLMY
jgi:polysaccharide biosynthesis protein PslC